MFFLEPWLDAAVRPAHCRIMRKCEGVFVPTAIAVRRRKEVYMNKISDINARRVRDAILEGTNIRQAKQARGPSFFS